MSYNIIPLTSDPDQNLSCTLPIDNKNKTLLFNFTYNSQGNYWWMKISDSETNQVFLDAVPLVAGEFPAADLLGQYSYLKIGSAMIIKTGTALNEIPDSTNLGTEYVLVWGDTFE